MFREFYAEKSPSSWHDGLQQFFVDLVNFPIFNEAVRVGVARTPEVVSHKISSLGKTAGNHACTTATGTQYHNIVHAC
jgi:hypothetical protein